MKNYVERTQEIRYISSAMIPISVIKASNWTRIQKHLSSGPYLFLSQLLIFLFFLNLEIFIITIQFDSHCYLDPVLYNIILWGKKLCNSDFKNKYASY